MTEELKQLEAKAREAIERAGSLRELNSLRVHYMGRRSRLVEILRSLGGLPQGQRTDVGKAANEAKASLEAALAAAVQSLGASAKRAPPLDVTLPGRAPHRGHLHPLTQTLSEVIDIFTGLGYFVEEGPEVELDYYNFEALNIPKDHPARDMQDTFYLGEDVVLRTHTSPVQVRVMERQPPPVKIIAPGKVYRRDADISHSPMFHQVEGLLVDEGVTFGDLKGTLELFVRHLFGEGVPTRFRPSFFPFTEPSAEVDIGCVMCAGSGCRLCGGSGWLEILGSGMVDPEVFRFVGYDAERYSGFAFGLGIERIAMLRYGVEDIRLFFENDLAFLEQF